MPKGIYSRHKTIESTVIDHSESQPNINGTPASNGIQTRFVKEDIRPETANAQTVEAVPQIAGSDEETTTQRLFGDILPEQAEALKVIPIAQSPLDAIAQEEAEDGKITKEEPVDVKAATEIKPEADKAIDEDILDFDKFGSKKIKTKVDGFEGEVSLKELRDSFQIRKHLNQAGEKVGEERRRLAEERKAWMDEQQQFRQNPQPNGQDVSRGNVPRGTNPDPFMAQRLAALEREIAESKQERNRERVMRELKDDGIENPEQYIAKAQAVMASDLSVAPFYDTPTGFKTLVKALAFEESKVQRIQPVLTPKEPVASVNIQRPPITRIDSGNNRTSGLNDDGQGRYRDNFKRAVQNGDSPEGRAAWNQVLLQKGILPSDE